MKKIFYFTTIILASALICLNGCFNAYAETANAGQALEISPPVITLTLDPGQVKTTNIKIRDIATTDLVVKGQVNDFVAAGEDGTPKLLIDESSDTDNPYSMKSWVSPLSEMTLKPKQIKELAVKISVPKNAAPGGYYASVRFTANPPGLDNSGVSLSASLGSLLLVKVNGVAKEDMSIVEAGTSYEAGGKNNILFESTPINFFQRIKNNGNIHEQPTGQISITDMFGKPVAVVNVNLAQKNILPNSIRRFDEPLDKSTIGSKILFGKYTAKLRLSYGSDNSKILTSEFTFWVIPYRAIGIGIIVLVGGFFALRFFIRRYNDHIIKKANYSRRRR